MIVESARIRFAGGNPKLADGFSAALKHLKSILVLAVIGAIVSIIVNAIQRTARGNSGLSAIATHLVAGLIGASWTIVSYFSLPVILSENTSATQSFKRSMELFGNLGENAVSNISLMALWLPAVLFLVLGLFVSPLAAAAVIAFVIGGILHSVAKGILSGIIRVRENWQCAARIRAGRGKNFYEKDSCLSNELKVLVRFPAKWLKNFKREVDCVF